jgi:neutral amino acid transport system permease protein
VTHLLQLVINGLTTGSIVALATVGFTLVYGILKIVNFAHGDYLTFGAYLAFVADVTLHWGIVAAAAVAILATGALSIGVEFVLWRPLRARRASMMTLFISSIGLSLALRNLIALGWGQDLRRYNVNVFQVYRVAGLYISRSQIIVIAVSAGALIAVSLLLLQTRTGRSMRALADNPSLAAVSGINTRRIVFATWLLAGGLTGLAGLLQGVLEASFDPQLGQALVLAIFAAAVVGGVGNAFGALIGGIAIGLVMEVSTWSGFAGGVSADYKPIVSFVVLAAVLLIRPSGLLGRARTI